MLFFHLPVDKIILNKVFCIICIVSLIILKVNGGTDEKRKENFNGVYS